VIFGETIMSVMVQVPATTANIGPGFDCLGAALQLYNRFTFTPQDAQITITASGVNADRVGLDADNMAYTSFVKLFDYLGKPVPGVKIDLHMEVPLARGLGSSATAIVGGLVGANVLAGNPLSVQAIADLATEIEGHPDNVVPALCGGCRLSATGVDRAWEVSELSWHKAVIPVVAIPAFELSTQSARAVLPATYGRSDVVFNMAHLGLLMQGLATGNADWLKAGLQDCIHQPFRKALIAHYDEVRSAAIAAGAHGMVISGAGPTLLALTDRDHSEAVRSAMVQAWETAGISAQALVLDLDRQGALILDP
jgi:homoserine kinase